MRRRVVRAWTAFHLRGLSVFRRLLGALALCFIASAPLALRADDRLAYPPAPRGNVVDDYFGTSVPDPYRWMEDLDSVQTKAWVADEAALTETYLARLPYRQAIRDHLKSLYNYERISAPSHESTTYLVSRNSGLQNQSVLYVSSGASGAKRVLVDPNTLASDGTVALGGTALSRNGKLLAYSTQVRGSDWQIWHVRDVATGKDLADTIEWAKFSGASWAHDSSGFYYSAYDKPEDSTHLNIVNYYQKAYFHRIGTPQSADRLMFSQPEHKDWFVNVDETEDGKYLIYSTSKGANNGIAYRDLSKPQSKPVVLFPNEKAEYELVDNFGPIFFIETNEGAPNGKVFALDVRLPEKRVEVIGEAATVLSGISSVGGKFFASYLKDAHTQIKEFARSGRLIREVALPGIGTANGFFGHSTDTQTYYTYSSYTTPGTTYRFDTATGKSTLYYRPATRFVSSRYTTEQIFFTSKDGARVPMFVSYKKGLPRDGSAPALLTGYGGFEIATRPGFSTAGAEWMEMGGVFVAANLRGGNEYGEAWHKAGMLDKKQNVFDDFIAAAQTLIDRKYTSTPKLAIEGGSNGGLLMGAVENQRPDLFGAVLANVGVMDMLRYQRFTVGNAWIPEYGSSEAGAAQFKTLYAYSPLHNVKMGAVFPPTLISTADNDTRVFPAHSFKYAAAMQGAQAGPAPILLFVELNAGHGGGKPLQKTIDEVGNQYAFLINALHFTPTIPSN
jgi:prolyl oligopeptidase